jgi:transposase
MHATTVGVDLAKNRFELAIADEQYRIHSRQRLSRTRFAQFFANQGPCVVVMEACGSAHHWGRTLQAQGHEVRLLPPQYVRAYVRRNKTDRADAAALIEAVRCADIHPVPVKSIDQQAIQHLHRLRAQWHATRTGYINELRGFMREAGIPAPEGAARGIAAAREALQSPENNLSHLLRPFMQRLLEQIRMLEECITELERSLRDLTRQDPIVQQLLQIPGVGLLTATAMRAAIGDIHRFPSARHLSSWLGLTPREHSSAEKRRLGGISKRGDVYLRTLLIHGARSALRAASHAARAGRPLDRLPRWAVQAQQRCGHNKATVALANKLARIIWATWTHQRPFNANWVRV